MLTKLLPDQISKFWPIIKYAVEESLPPTVGEHSDKMNRVLSAMLCGKLEVWALYKKKEDVVKFEAILVTQFLYDEASNTKNLLLYCLYGYSVISQDSWSEGFEALYKYAKAEGCGEIVAYSANDNVIDEAKSFGADTSFTFISFKIV
jgi:hypothetical protein